MCARKYTEIYQKRVFLDFKTTYKLFDSKIIIISRNRLL